MFGIFCLFDNNKYDILEYISFGKSVVFTENIC